ncbi:ArpA protein [Parashewanella spongiae]|uniref:ArpA protein n=1 Tax=Parashewanella spongiae TaxID=342950 RepID=A0A3A6U510_9GAMM|nr:ArpA protein [Parashewanella spongiae]MCL1078667.1 hypothetical protein [Parashewanella spongiae]RJY12959.1 ArpA protein [Parashewanella spongiae]
MNKNAEVYINVNKKELRDFSHHFSRYGVVKVTELISESLCSLVLNEAKELLSNFAERRDLHLATTDFSPRSMSVVTSENIANHGDRIPFLYFNDALRPMLEDIAGETLCHCPKKDEEFLISRHEKAGDTHGWHWGDFRYALIWVLQAPAIEVGGLLQCVPHTSWNKQKPRIFNYLCENPINTYYFGSGDVYFLKADSTLHRTIPLQQDMTRIMLNMTWASNADLTKDIEGDDRWWDDESVNAAIQK